MRSRAVTRYASSIRKHDFGVDKIPNNVKAGGVLTLVLVSIFKLITLFARRPVATSKKG